LFHLKNNQIEMFVFDVLDVNKSIQRLNLIY